jgi:hypothetical protein
VLNVRGARSYCLPGGQSLDRAANLVEQREVAHGAKPGASACAWSDVSVSIAVGSGSAVI